MKRFVLIAVFAGLAVDLYVAVARTVALEEPKDQKVAPAVKTVNAADLADAFAADAEKASRDFSPKTGGPLLQVTGRVTKVINGQALLNNADSKVRIYLSLGDKKTKIGDLIDATVKKLSFDPSAKNLVVHSDSVKIAPESSGGRISVK